ncbi:hypothetical protein LN042_00380 [Kitasatospora sp. RB6PN24]|uniref:hypothetical protein n=1 Tax=Kitasatospora humi TaxID=2893891 RepID=UPI001E62175E|nr:hypothetical protein [Kitasatospora humi]MCC9305585.1 hypothetical protein [Kitasatospora humi]
MDEPRFPGRSPLSGHDPVDQVRFPLPKRHRRLLACAAVAASVALGGLGVGATVETVGHQQVSVNAGAEH